MGVGVRVHVWVTDFMLTVGNADGAESLFTFSVVVRPRRVLPVILLVKWGGI